MGLRFRKSKNFGPFRINISKSGIGGSVGVKGFRITKKATGGVQATASLPGTGLSYTKNLGACKKASQKANGASKNAAQPTVQNGNPHTSQSAPKNTRQALLAKLLLCLFLGCFGVHKFYEKKTGLGVLYLLTLGLFGIGWLGDSILLFMALISKNPNDYDGFRSQAEKRIAQWVIYGGCALFMLIVCLVASKNTPREHTLSTPLPVTEPETQAAAEPPAPTLPVTTPTEASTQPPTEEPTKAPTQPPPTEKPTAPATQPPTEEPLQPTKSPTASSTDAPTEPEPAPDAVFSYVINTSTGKFHKPSCGSASKIKEENRWDYAGTRQSVLDMGYSPCGHCHP